MIVFALLPAANSSVAISEKSFIELMFPLVTTCVWAGVRRIVTGSFVSFSSSLISALLLQETIKAKIDKMTKIGVLISLIVKLTPVRNIVKKRLYTSKYFILFEYLCFE